MTIFEVCTSDSLGGLELYFATCCRKLSERGHTVFALVSNNSRLHKMLEQDVECIILPKSIIKKFFFSQRLVNDKKPSVIHIHHKKDIFLGALLKRVSGSSFKYIHTRQMDLPGNKKNTYHSFVYRSMDLIIAITDRLKGQILDRISVAPSKVVRLYYGVPLVEAKPKRCAEIDLRKADFNVGVIARIDHKKEQAVIIESTKSLIEENKNIHVYLVGGSTDDEYHTKLVALIKELEVEDYISLTGFINSPQELMTCFDTVVLTTGNETFGLVLPEAMRMGVAVIGANGGGVPEIIDHGINGLMFEAGNSDDLKNQLEVMMDAKQREKLAEKGKAKADQLFELENHFDELEELFLEVNSMLSW